jgi:hypothetical protein
MRPLCMYKKKGSINITDIDDVKVQRKQEQPTIQISQVRIKSPSCNLHLRIPLGIRLQQISS